MAIKLYNTLSGKLEAFEPIESGTVKMFVCGPTVYDFSHIGHGKTYTQFDVVVRALRYVGYRVTYIVNITDIDDKIIKRADERGVEPSVLAKEYEQAYVEDMRVLGNTNVNKYARAHDYIPEIVSQVERLVEKGLAYKISNGYYFDTKGFEDYGKLSGRNALKTGDAVSRIDENPDKKNPGDFCLWKFKKEGEPFWPANLGEGRPGWHIEDTAITEAEFGPQYDIHGGAIDLIFPHHEAEIAQMESISGKKPLVRYWLHAGFLNIKSEKMSKSLGNFLTIREVLEKGISPLALRYYFLTAHYRTSMDFSWEALTAAQNAYRKLKEFFSSLRSNLENSKGSTLGYSNEFKEAISNDFNTPEALAVVWKLIRDESVFPADKYATLLGFDKVLGLDLEHNEFEIKEIPGEVQKLVDEREETRTAGNYQKADKLREHIESLGFVVEDTLSGPKISKS
ncbi:MAG: Cysteine-tRNA ligase [Parcubacteria group bacterium GW2011_GWA1_49_11]|nr:MAG: Cysteine-tRNA ligase [Parcubacteria group bacterium GW2011_GWA1_49_11]